MLELGRGEEPDDLQRRVAGVVDRVRHELRHDRQLPRVEGDALTVDLRLARAVHDVEDLLGAVRVASQVLAGLDLEVTTAELFAPASACRGNADRTRIAASASFQASRNSSSLTFTTTSFRFTSCKP